MMAARRLFLGLCQSVCAFLKKIFIRICDLSSITRIIAGVETDPSILKAIEEMGIGTTAV